MRGCILRCVRMSLLLIVGMFRVLWVVIRRGGLVFVCGGAVSGGFSVYLVSS